MNKIIANLEALLEKNNSALLRYSLGAEYLKEQDYAKAIEHLSAAVRLDPGYSAAWKLYGRALTAAGEAEKAAEVYAKGIDAAEEKGDMQAAKEMRVFLRRIGKS